MSEQVFAYEEFLRFCHIHLGAWRPRAQERPSQTSEPGAAVEPRDQVEKKVEDLERLALSLLGQAKDLLETAMSLRELLSLAAGEAPGAHADGHSPR